MVKRTKVKCYTNRIKALQAAKRLGKIVVVSEKIIERKNQNTGRTRLIKINYFCLAKKPKNWGKVS